VYNAKTVKSGTNTNLQMHKGIMSMITMRKNILTDIYIKYKVSSDWSTCMPLFTDVPSASSLNPLRKIVNKKNIPMWNLMIRFLINMNICTSLKCL
jgi:hypothetical protein